jgi:hypothetical protein
VLHGVVVVLADEVVEVRCNKVVDVM